MSLDCGNDRSDAKVGKFDGSLSSYEEVPSLDVPVYHSLAMEIDEAFKHLTDVNGSQRLGEEAITSQNLS